MIYSLNSEIFRLTNLIEHNSYLSQEEIEKLKEKIEELVEKRNLFNSITKKQIIEDA